MIWLRNSDRFDEVIKFYVTSGNYTSYSEEALGEDRPRSLAGFFAILSGGFIALFTLRGKVFVYLGGRSIELSDDTTANVSGEPDKRQLSVKKDGEELGRIEYALDTSRRFENDPTPFIDDEDFDFGLFVANISNSKDRKRVLLGLDE